MPGRSGNDRVVGAETALDLLAWRKFGGRGSDRAGGEHQGEQSSGHAKVLLRGGTAPTTYQPPCPVACTQRRGRVRVRTVADARVPILPTPRSAPYRTGGRSLQ